MSLLAAMWDSGVDSVNGRRWTAAARANRSSYPGWESSGSFLPVLGGGDDCLEGAAEVGDGAGEDLVGPVGQAGQAGHVGRAFGEGRAQSLVHQAHGGGGQAAVS